MKLFIPVSVIIVFSWLFLSCTKDEKIFSSNNIPTQIRSNGEVQFDRDTDTNDGTVVLGQKRDNPFTVENINQAKAIVYGANMPDKYATHRYIQFKPTTEEHLDSLEDWETNGIIPLFDIPFEYEIISDGDTYFDPSAPDSIYTFQYASIPIGIELPNVPYEIIDELYIDKSDPLLLAESFLLTGNGEEINEYVFDGGLSTSKVGTYGTEVLSALMIPIVPDIPCPEGYEWMLVIEFDVINPNTGIPIYQWECVEIPPPPPPLINACGCPIPGNTRFPAGCLRVEHDFGLVPVEIASINVKDAWFGSDQTYTDENGCWRINRSYSGKVWMWVRFKNPNVKARDTRYWLSLRAVRDFAGRFNAPPYNNILVEYNSGAADNTSRVRRYWAAAHSLNTVNQYRNAAAGDGVPQPRTALNWTNAAGEGGAAAPMLQWNLFNSWPSFIAAVVFPPLYIASLAHLPDILNQYDINETAVRFTGTGFHELGHASHYSLAGEGYWVGYRNHIINNGGYGAFGNFNGNCCPGRVALGEAIGNFTGAIYGNTPAGGENFEWENNFIPRGLMWDLGDNTLGDNVTDPNDATITGLDNISGFTPSMIFNGLTPNVNDVRTYRDRLRTLHLGDTPNNAADFNNFVDLYDVFN